MSSIGNTELLNLVPEKLRKLMALQLKWQAEEGLMSKVFGSSRSAIAATGSFISGSSRVGFGASVASFSPMPFVKPEPVPPGFVVERNDFDLSVVVYDEESGNKATLRESEWDGMGYDGKSDFFRQLRYKPNELRGKVDVKARGEKARKPKKGKAQKPKDDGRLSLKPRDRQIEF